MTPPVDSAPLPPEPVRERMVAVLWASAVEALGNAVIVSVLGSVALSLVGSLVEDMAPTLPPFLTGHSPPASGGSSLARGWWGPLKQHGFGILWALFFVHAVWVRLAGSRSESEPRGAAVRARRVLARFSADWFGLIVGNAFGALLSALVLSWIPQFSFYQMLWGWLLEPLLGALHTLATHLFGPARMDSLDGLLSWYHENHFRFTFWVFYVAAVCDDLGLPNIKTLARWAWRRSRRALHEPPALTPRPKE